MLSFYIKHHVISVESYNRTLKFFKCVNSFNTQTRVGEFHALERLCTKLSNIMTLSEIFADHHLSNI